MTLDKEKLTELSTNKIYSYMFPVIEKLYTTLISSELFNTVVFESIHYSRRHYDDSIPYSEYLYALIKNRIDYEILNNYINSNFNIIDGFTNKKSFIQALLDYARENSIEINEPLYEQLQENELFRNIVSSVYLSYKDFADDVEEELSEDILDSNSEYYSSHLPPKSILNDSSALILREINTKPLLSAEETLRLLKDYQETGNIESKNKLIESNLRLVVFVAKRYVNYMFSLSELIQQGSLGLSKAIDKFDFSRNAKLSTYAIPWIKQYIERYIVDHARNVRIPGYKVNIIRKNRNRIEELTRELGREPTIDEIKDRLHLSEEDLVQINVYSLGEESLDRPIGDEDDGASFGNFLSSEYDIEDNLIKDDLKKQIALLIDSSNLNSGERKVIDLRFGFTDGNPQTLESIGKVLHVTRERIRQIEIRALAKLRKRAKRMGISIYADVINPPLYSDDKLEIKPKGTYPVKHNVTKPIVSNPPPIIPKKVIDKNYVYPYPLLLENYFKKCRLSVLEINVVVLLLGLVEGIRPMTLKGISMELGIDLNTVVSKKNTAFDKIDANVDVESYSILFKHVDLTQFIKKTETETVKDDDENKIDFFNYYGIVPIDFIREILLSSYFESKFNQFSDREKTIIMLRFGLLRDKFYSIEELSFIFGMSEDDIKMCINRGILLIKKYISEDIQALSVIQYRKDKS